MDISKKRLIVCNKILDILSKTNESSGYIAGLEKNEEVLCLAASLSTEYFLSGLTVIGIYCMIENELLPEDEFINICQNELKTLMVELENPIVLFAYKKDDSTNLIGKVYSTYYGSISDIHTTFTFDNPVVLLRAKGKLPLLFETTNDPDTVKENLEFAIEKLRVITDSQVAAFLLQDSSFILTSSHEENDSTITCGTLPKYIQDTDLAESVKKLIKNSKKKIPVDFDILIQTSGDAALENTVNHSLVIHCQRREYQCVSLSLPIDILILCIESSPACTIYKLMLKAIRQQLEKMRECLLTHTKNLEFICPVPYHFYPESWNVPFTVIYPFNKTDFELENYRRNLHKILLLPLDRPLLKKSNTYTFSNVVSGYLINPHEGLSSGVVGGKASIVYGRYSYHHYMQDHINDNGWGCAYRSLQTIISWFKFQGYTDINIPTHTEIQEALVDIGDKAQSFVGTKKWIGSQEVSFCVDYFLKIESKILCINSGAEMANKGRELFLHFRDQGTPIMIGGGVLAHTILGVDFNENTGDLKFLILDPHYTGGEDLHIVQSKGWCGWKGVNFWDQNAFYNLCLPQRPLQV